MRLCGTFGRAPWRFASRRPVRYRLLPGRDGVPGRNLFFATYMTVMDAAESAVLSGAGGWPRLPAGLLDQRSLLEREVFYISHTTCEQTVVTDVRARLAACPADIVAADGDVAGAAILETHFELYEERTCTLLAIARARKLVSAPRGRASLRADLERWSGDLPILAEAT
jgi:hypothetical protein